MSWPCNTLAVVLAFLVSPFSAHSAASKDPWQSVVQLPHHASFMYLERDRTCHFGQIKEVTDKSVTVHTDKSDVTITRSNLLRIQRGRPNIPNSPYQALTVVYSGRSSWADIVGFMLFLSKNPSFEVHMSVATSNGTLRKGDLKDVTETEIILHDSFGKETHIPRTKISRVDYIQAKPLSDNQEFYWEELAPLKIFDPVLYPRMFRLGNTFPVRLYDSAAPEDDSLVQCR